MRGVPDIDGTDAARLRGNESPVTESKNRHHAPPGADGFSVRISANIASFHQE
jgi:hypothetical protein